MTSTPKFAHVVLMTSQPEQMAEFYCTLLHGHIVHQGHGLCFMTFDDEHHRIALLTPPEPLEPKKPGTVGMHHTAYTFAGLDELLERYRELKAKGIEPHVPIQHGVITSLYYRDPDGNFAEMQVDNFATPDEATRYMEGPEYGDDPVGPSFRPQLMVDARRSGTSERELQTRAWALATSPGLPDPLVALTS
jgi:catechol-2,3-dioxygenase